MLESSKRKFAVAIADKELISSLSEYISELGICQKNFCRNCKGFYCRDDTGFYDLDYCPSGRKERLGEWFVLPRSAWNFPCNGRDCEYLMICFVSAVRELFYDCNGRCWYPEVIKKIRQYDLWERLEYSICSQSSYW